MKHDFDKTILRAYDIRGVYKKTLHNHDAKVLGHLLGLKLKKNKIVNIGFDGRKSSIALKKFIKEGLLETGANVREIGLGPTPMLYYSCQLNNAEMGIMITGSHNPPDHNGFKIIKDNLPFYGDDIFKLLVEAKNYNFECLRGSDIFFDVKGKYIDELISSLNQKKGLNIVWDAGNGASGDIMRAIAEKIDGEKSILFSDIDGSFPNHHPDPSEVKNLKDVINSVQEKKCDFGIAFDGDGDRIGVVDDLGRPVPGDILLLLFSIDILKKKKNITIIGDVKCSKIFFDEVERLGGKAIMSKTGHSLIKKCMKSEKAILAGEMSGHIFFADNYFGFDDAHYAAIRLINLMSSTNIKLSKILDSLPNVYNTPEIRIDCDDTKKFEIIKKMIGIQKHKKIKFNDTDGIRVNLKKGWWLIRASNTQPSIVLRCEAETQDELTKIILSVKKDLYEIDQKLSKQILT